MSDEKIKGSAQRLVTVPGYHIYPQYDLNRTRHVVDARRSQKRGFSLMLAPMVDMFSILVIYLLMNFSSSGDIFFISKELALPRASKGTPLKSFPLISVVGPYVMFDAEQSQASGPLSIQEANDEKVPLLRELLKRLQSLDGKIHPGQPFKGEVNLQADGKTSAEDVKKVMRVLISEGWSGINFIVDPRKDAAR